MPRNTVISICKAIAIILMVIGHADCPAALSQFLYEFHMPVFFITAGYFFSLRYLTDEATFVRKRFKGLYVPFLKWSVFFLIIHNWMFDLGILNEQYGNWSGGVTHPYTWHQMQQSFWNMVFAMGGYDQFLCGAFWFFRGLLVASIAYLFIYKGVDKLVSRLPGVRNDSNHWSRTTLVPVTVCVLMLLIAAWKTSEGLRVITLVQGGYREIMGTFFFGCGFLFRKWEQQYLSHLKNGYITLGVTVLLAIVVWLFSQYLTANMNWRSSFEQFLWLPVPALCGFLMTYHVSRWLDRHEGWLKRFLVFCGDNTLPVFIFHIISYKLVSLLKIWYYDLDFAQIGCHMVIHDHAQDDWFWVLYAIAGAGIPLAWTWGYRRVKERIAIRHRPSGIAHQD